MTEANKLRRRGPFHDHEMEPLRLNHKSSLQGHHPHTIYDVNYVLYEDSIVRVTRDELVIKRYYFPLMNSKRLKWSRVKSAKCAKDDNVKWYELKIWGFGLGNIWWAAQLKILSKDENGRHHLFIPHRIINSCIIIKCHSSCIRNGICVERPTQALEAINHMIVYINRAQNTSYDDNASDIDSIFR